VNDRFDYPSARALCGLLLILLALGAPLRAAELNVYSARKEALIKPLLDKYSAASGVTVNLVTGKGDALLTRLQTEGRNSPADVLITTDAGRLYRAHEAGVLQKIASPALDAAIPAHLRSEQGDWYGLSVRARAIVYARDRVQPGDLSSYEDLADPKWKRRICIRSSSNIYNQSLVASMLAAHGGEKTDAWLRGLVANFARPPVGGDRDQVLAAAAGQCDVVIVNTYYLAAMLNDKSAQREAAEKLKVFWPNQNGQGAHVNISGIGLTTAARHRDNAVRLIEYLASTEAQTWYAEVNHEYPIRSNIPVSKTLAAMGKFKADTLNLHQLGQHNAEAVKLMDRAGWK